MTAELPRHSWMTLLGESLDTGPDLDPVPEVGRALREVLALTTGGEDAVVAHRHVISELLLETAMTDRERLRFATPGHESGWSALASVVPEPARARCVQLAMWCNAASYLPEATA